MRPVDIVGPVGAPDDSRYEAGAAELGRVARVLDERIDEPRHAAGRERLLLARSTRSKRSRRSTRALAWLAAAVALVAAAALVIARRPARLEYRLAGPAVADGPWLGVARSGGPLPVNFSDGTEVDLGPGSKGRIDDVTADGARFVLGAGVLQARVVHRPHAHWAVAAGPYTIEVTGTAFDVAWSIEDEKLELSLHDGSVVVRGPSLPDGLRVAAGQRLVARAGTGDAQLSSLLAAPPLRPHVDAPDAPDGPDASPAAPADSTPGEPSPGHPAPRSQMTWSEMLTDGNFRGILEAAEDRGVDATLSRGSRADVVALADAARYSQERALAKRGLLTERARFGGSAEAHGAAFLLGRMADEDGARGEAIRWYDTYLAESPAGAFVAEALGRKLVALVESGDTARAPAVARDYLTRFPHGAHAAYARDHVPGP